MPAIEPEFQYIDQIISALTKLYTHDGNLFDRHTHEQTYSFRLALYLAQQLERGEIGRYVDCEYHRDCYRNDGRKTVFENGQAHRFRPDIIFHDRGYSNYFCIELKKGSPRDDVTKVAQIIEQYAYDEGYCICNISIERITIYCIDQSRIIRRQYRFNQRQQRLEVYSNQVINSGSILA